MNVPGPSASIDVRMRGFGQLTPLSKALEWIDIQTKVLGSVRVAIEDSMNRVLAQDIIALADIPNFARSAMDGFAISEGQPKNRLRIVGQSKPGKPFETEIRPGEAIRIMTGAPVPLGAISVVPIEKCRSAEGTIELLEEVSIGKHIAQPGEDVRQGCVVLSNHRVLRPQDIGMLSSLGIASVDVVQKPRVVIVTSGAELLPPGTPPRGCLIADTNTVMLQAMTERDGGIVVGKHRIEDDPQLLRNVIRQTDWDILLLNGGTSVGAEDFSPVVLREFASAMIHGIDMKPGMPSGVGVLEDQRMVFLLPGNPVACMFTYDVLARRHLRQLAKRSLRMPYDSCELKLVTSIESKLGRTDFVRVKIDRGLGEAKPFPMAGASNLSGIVNADGFTVVGELVERLGVGETVEVFCFDHG